MSDSSANINNLPQERAERELPQMLESVPRQPPTLGGWGASKRKEKD